MGKYRQIRRENLLQKLCNDDDDINGSAIRTENNQFSFKEYAKQLLTGIKADLTKITRLIIPEKDNNKYRMSYGITQKKLKEMRDPFDFESIKKKAENIVIVDISEPNIKDTRSYEETQFELLWYSIVFKVKEIKILLEEWDGWVEKAEEEIEERDKYWEEKENGN